MALTAAQISNLGVEIAGLDVTIVQQQILAAAFEMGVAKRTVTPYMFEGVGRILNLPYQTAVEFGSALAEGIEVTHVISDIQPDAVTMAKYTLDRPISFEGENWGAGSAIQAISEDCARAYSNKVDGLIHAAVNAIKTTNDVDAGATVTLAHLATAYSNLLALKAPKPYILLLHPEHYVDIFGTATLTAYTSGKDQDFMGGPAPNGYLGKISGFEAFTDPNCTGTGDTASSLYFAQRGVYWVWKNAMMPEGSSGELGLEIQWRYDFRSYVVSATMIGAANVRRLGGSDTPWAGNIYNPA